MLSIIVEYISLFMQVAAAAIAISMFKRTKFNSSWILISIGFLLMAISRVLNCGRLFIRRWKIKCKSYNVGWLLLFLWCF